MTPYFERRYILKTISFGIYVRFWRGSNWYLSGNEIGSIEVRVMRNDTKRAIATLDCSIFGKYPNASKVIQKYNLGLHDLEPSQNIQCFNR